MFRLALAAVAMSIAAVSASTFHFSVIFHFLRFFSLRQRKYSVKFVLPESDFVDTFVGGICQFCENERFGQCTAMGIAVVGSALC